MIKSILLVGTGGFAGSALRYMISRFMTTVWPSAFPFGTFAVNMSGCFLIGIILAFTLQNSISTQARLLLATGFCGGFTTFSSFSLEVLQSWQQGEIGISLAYMAGSVALGIAAVAGGFVLAQYFLQT